MKSSSGSLDIKPISGAVGAEIHGVDLKDNIPEEQFSEIKSAFGEYGVIFFRDQNLTPDQEITFARRWGKININRFFTSVNDYPEIAMVLKEPNQKKNIGGMQLEIMKAFGPPIKGFNSFTYHFTKR